MRYFVLSLLVLLSVIPGCSSSERNQLTSGGGYTTVKAGSEAPRPPVGVASYIQTHDGMIPGQDYIPDQLVVGFDRKLESIHAPAGAPNPFSTEVGDTGLIAGTVSNPVLYENAHVATFARRLASEFGLSIVRCSEAYVRNLNFCTYQLPAGANPYEIARLIRIKYSSAVTYVEFNQVLHALFSPNDPKWQDGTLWGLSKTECDLAWDTATGSGVKVAVIDSGIRQTHEDLTWLSVPGTNLDLVNDDQIPEDQVGHGTHVSGTIGAIGDNGKGVIGVGYQCTILPIKVINASGWATTGATAAGIALATQLGANVINMSLGSSYSDRTSAAATTDAWNAGLVVVAAAGNESTSQPSYPGALPEIINVGATNNADGKAGYSNFGNTVDIAAPGGAGGGGGQIYSTTYSSATSYGYMQGTSMATPHVAGAAAVLRSSNPALSPAETRGLLEGYGDDTLNQGQWQAAVHLLRLNVNNPIGKTVSNMPTISFTNYNDGDSVITTFTLKVNPDAPNGLVGVHFYMDGEHLDYLTSAPWEITLDPVTFIPGNHVFVAEVVDSNHLHGFDWLTLNVALPPTATPYWSDIQDAPYSDNWVSVNYSGSGTWQEIGTTDKMLYCGDPNKSGGAGYYADDMDALLTPNFDLRGLLQPVLAFRLKYDLAANDYLLLRMVDDGGGDNLLGYVTGRNADWPNWTPTSVGMSAAFNRTARIEFWLYQQDASGTAEGIYIDDVVASEYNNAPVPAIISPTAHEVVHGTKLISADVTDEHNVVNLVELYAGGSLVGTTVLPPYESNWDTTALADGTYVVQVKAYDEWSIFGYVPPGSAIATVHVHNTPPVIDTFAPSAAPVGGQVTITGSGFGSFLGVGGMGGWQQTFVYFDDGLGGRVEAGLVSTDWTDTQIICTVPAGAGDGPLTVAIGDVEAVSPTSFTLGTLSGFAFTFPAPGFLMDASTGFSLVGQPFATRVSFTILEAPGIPIADDTTPDSISFSLQPLQFPANGKYTLEATAYAPADQVSTELVLFVEKLPGDFNSDNFVTQTDLDFLRLHMWETPLDPGWLAYLDTNRNGIVDESDAATVGYHFRETA